MANPAGDEADERLPRLRLGEIELLNLERLAEPLQDCGVDSQFDMRSATSCFFTDVRLPGVSSAGIASRISSALL